ncbi:hypothetical protein DPEC_G00162870 [Dallia pectoralis]|uniref:Uncharacterized protein n=1 Tax=Dallia pectoralis TaxID=75939 RepID=A0ACC2GGZ2_DALPE|nr:hypothetical protein DPEC_G00162870 [Dallia pectoralis]
MDNVIEHGDLVNAGRSLLSHLIRGHRLMFNTAGSPQGKCQTRAPGEVPRPEPPGPACLPSSAVNKLFPGSRR